ncbi:putative U1 small nuclear ribonucleoprotein C [Ordospora pajunii]|uniref:putative U1 small nuclear ribonucleoprotein C n=1 Tax=Ordospora pajunii TaxID=3039483 RepID=UPI0029527544|nr:putative U1 small nuclear ribonucleoprotein C [Ordospora pajunii]KAH9411516.1 putative U1 small nuclear ribonucleoprotein C [Ordospora pajunii]
MAKYFCEFCNKFLPNDKPKSRKMHFQGARHGLMRKAYYMEVFEQDTVAAELNSILKNLKTADSCLSHTIGHRQNTECNLPPGICLSEIHVPEEPPGFRLPPGFDFNNPANFPRTMDEVVRRYR